MSSEGLERQRPNFHHDEVERLKGKEQLPKYDIFRFGFESLLHTISMR